MAAASTSQDNLSQSGQNLIRILIASYFIAVSIGLIAGTSAIPLAAIVLPPEPAELVGSSAFFILGFLVLTGIWLRPAAMLLALILFWSSFIVNFGPSETAALGDFWRDLALVGALMLTYVRSVPRAIRGRAMIRWTPRARRVGANTKVAPRRVVAAQPSNVTRLRSATVTPINRGNAANDVENPVENIFRDDRDDMIAS